MSKIFETHLIVYKDRSEYVTSPEVKQIFEEGAISDETKRTTKLIKEKFEAGFLENLICEIRDKKVQIDLTKINEITRVQIDGLVESVTSEVGRALIGLTVMQLCIKAMEPTQNIRLHKGSVNNNSFSWRKGISMRVLDKTYVTPALRRHGLLKLNADGFMMTRSLAENYPYSILYKAQLRGARDEWLSIVEALESGSADPINSLRYLVSLLFNKADHFKNVSDELLSACKLFLNQKPSTEEIIAVIKAHINNSDYAARLMEISMHSLMQAAVSSGAFGLATLKPLSQMRSANKKHGNIGDVELLEGREIVESWDAKYGKAYLRDEIDEVIEKIESHNSVATLGFVTTVDPIRNAEVNNKISDYSALHGLTIQILTFDDWIAYIYSKVVKAGFSGDYQLSSDWLIAYAESLAQKRRDVAPIDEPCIDWVGELKLALSANLKS